MEDILDRFVASYACNTGLYFTEMELLDVQQQEETVCQSLMHYWKMKMLQLWVVKTL